MSLQGCARREEMRAMLALGHWPAGCSAELRAHVDGCEECRVAVALTQGMQGSRLAARPALPSAELVWWRAQLRKRQAAMERVQRPLRGAEVFGVALTLCVAVGLAAWLTMSGVWTSLAVERSLSSVWMFALAGAAVLLVSGVVVYLKLDAE